VSLVAARGLAVALGGRTVLTAVDLAVGPGEIVGVMGPSGCGKTTLVRALAGLLPPAAGTVVRTAGRPAVVFQAPRLLPWADVLDNAAFGAVALDLSGDDARAAAAAALERVGLGPETHRRRPHALSGGMGQRVGFARALATDPDLLLLDEPFNAVHDALRRRLEGILRERARAGAGCLLVTHDTAEAGRLCDRVAQLGGAPATVTGYGLPAV